MSAKKSDNSSGESKASKSNVHVLDEKAMEEKAVNEGKVKELVRQIQNSPTRFASRKIQGFSHPGAK